MRFSLLVATLMAATAITPALAQDANPEASQAEVQVEREPREARESAGVIGEQPRPSPEQRQERRAERQAERQADGGGQDGGWQGSGLGGLNRVLRQANPYDPSRAQGRTPEERAAHRDWRSVRQGEPYGDDGGLIERRRQHRDEAARAARQGYGGYGGTYSGGYGQGYGYGQGGGYGQGYGYGAGDGQGYNDGYRQTYGYSQGGGYSQNYGSWNRDWRRDRRYDWQRYRYANRDRFDLGQYRAPYGWNNGYRRFSVGISLSQVFFSERYWIADPYAYRLPPAYDPYRWVRYYDDILLVDLRTGRVVDAIYDFFD